MSAFSPTQPGLAHHGIESHWFDDEPSARRLLFAYAHPDDESFGNAGTIARYSTAGVDVHYVCATRGECGTVAASDMADFADIASLRSAELACAAEALGLTAIHHLNYRDSGMAGTADNQHPQALAAADLQLVTGQLVAAMRAIRPQVVVTFNAYGGYGHPDHIVMHQATLAAFAAAGDPQRYAEQLAQGLEPWQPSKLYVGTFATLGLRTGIAAMRLLRRDPRRVGTNADIDLIKALEAVTPLTTRIATAAYATQRERAWRCHHSQLGSMSRVLRLPRPLRRMFSRSEDFTRLEPAWNGGPRERDLFAGLPA